MVKVINKESPVDFLFRKIALKKFGGRRPG